ncbi:IS4 family transposase [Cerasicoccus maritimus]|uniref:IS4 family transposase n=1 Tax=Cerasicoccus maritimus TaxID=490089 RepID=UPI002852BFF1|nr:IS4 family transposase [Cerasicoccus maritimus]
MSLHTPFFPALVGLTGGRRGGLSNVQREWDAGQWQSLYELLFPASRLRRSGERQRLFPTSTAFYSLLHQGLHPDSAVREALQFIQADCYERRASMPGAGTGGLCQAQRRVPLSLLDAQHRRTVERLDATMEPVVGFGARHIKLIDGTGLSCDDTAANRHYFPPAVQCRKGCGFPLMQLVGLFSLNHGGLLKTAVTEMPESEIVVFNAEIASALEPGDILVGDTAYYAFWNVHELRQRQVDAVLAMPADAARGARTVAYHGCAQDRLVELHLPNRHRKHLTKLFVASLPKRQFLRVIETRRLDEQGRPKALFIATTLTDPQRYLTEKILELYFRRWQVEVNFRDLKRTLNFRHVRARSPEMVERRLRAAWIAYNVVRIVMLEAAKGHLVALESVSFKGALKGIKAYAPLIHRHRRCRSRARAAFHQMLEGIARDKVPRRPKRTEPRRVKLRDRNYLYLTRPRHIEKTIIEHQKARMKQQTKNTLN